MNNSEWHVYRTRFLVRAKQLTGPLFFVDGLGREHRGKRGDYLIETSTGTLRIAPRQLFEDIYVAMEPPPEPGGFDTPASVSPAEIVPAAIPPAKGSANLVLLAQTPKPRKWGAEPPACRKARPASIPAANLLRYNI